MSMSIELINQFLNQPEGEDYTAYGFGDSAKIPEKQRLIAMSKNENSGITNRLNKSLPTDRFCFSNEDLIHFNEMVMRDKLFSQSGAYSDLFFAHQIPIMDCEINITLASKYILKYRVHIRDDYIAILNEYDKLDEKTSALMGYITIPVVGNPGYIICSIYVNKISPRISFSLKVGFYNMPESLFKEFIEYVDREAFMEVAGRSLNTWYIIQLLLLHPQIKEVFQNPETVRNYSDTIRNTPNSNKKKLCYIKKHVISDEKIEKVLKSGPGNKRHALVWHVIGHWRTYKSGKKVFIQPYWKGVLRDTKQSETVERIIVKPD